MRRRPSARSHRVSNAYQPEIVPDRDQNLGTPLSRPRTGTSRTVTCSVNKPPYYAMRGKAHNEMSIAALSIRSRCTMAADLFMTSDGHGMPLSTC